MDINNIRNFSIIAHIDHGKSTLADRFLEVTGTVEKRKMKDQVLDSMELERERGITIKMQPARMEYKLGKDKYILNLIDTPGHIDFSYEVSRAMKAVEGAILLVDSTQGVQAQTMTTLEMAKKAGLVIIPAISKVDSPLSRPEEVSSEIAKLLDCDPKEVMKVSGKTGEGVEDLLRKIVDTVPAPKKSDTDMLQSLVFDFSYSSHRGIVVYMRVFSGSVKKGDTLTFLASNESFIVNEVGVTKPEELSVSSLGSGEIGYIVTGIKKPKIASVGDTLTLTKQKAKPLSGYEKPNPVVWASIFPESQDDFTILRQALERLQLSDSSLTFEEESSGVLGRGFRIGVLGMLHLEIVTERLKREFKLDLVITTPSITYNVIKKNGESEIVYSPHKFPDDGSVKEVHEPWADIVIISPERYLGTISSLLFEHEGDITHTETMSGGNAKLSVSMPLRELMRNFFDKLKSATQGYASISYEIVGDLPADVVRLDILINEDVVPAFSSVVSRRRAYEEAEEAVETLEKILPRQQVAIKIQGRALGRIVASRKLSAFRKDVTQHMYGGDITRKMKLREKQKKGKKKMQEGAKVNIPHDVFLKMMRRGGDK